MYHKVILSFLLLFYSSVLTAIPPMAYICDFGTNTISVINTASNAIVATIPVGANPSSSALTPDGKYLYVTNSGEYTVSVIDAVHNVPYATISLPATGSSFPQDVAITPDGKYAYVVICGDNTTNNATVINTATNTVVAVINFPSNSYPFNVAITPNGEYAYAMGNDGNLYVVSTQTNSIVKTVTGIFNNPFGIVFSPDGNYAYVSNESSPATITVINTASYAVSSINLTGPGAGDSLGGLAVTPNGFYIYTVDVLNSYVFVVDTRNGQTVATIPVTFGGLQAIGITPDGNYAYFSGNFGTIPGLIGIISTQSNQQVGTISIPGINGNAPCPEGVTIAPLFQPLYFSGVQKINNFGVAQEHFNALSWGSSVSEINGYTLTRNGQVISTLAPTAVTYQDHNQPLKQNSTYTLQAFNNAGSTSYAPSVTVNYKL